MDQCLVQVNQGLWFKYKRKDRSFLDKCDL